MFFTIAICSCVILIGVLFWNRSYTKGGNKLPGPTPLPILGNLLQIGFRPHITYTIWAKRCGPIYGFKLGLENAIVVTDHKLIKELFNEPASTGRMADNPIVMEFTKGPYGIINSSGPTCETQRKFTVRTLRMLGFAKTSMETMILDEVHTMLDWLRKQEGSPISGVRIFNAPVINSLWRLVTGDRCKWEESRPVILDAMEEFFKASTAVFTNGLFFAPVLKFLAPNLFGWNRYVASVNTMLKLFQESIKNIRKLSIPRRCDSNLVAGLYDLFFAGSETSSLTLSWSLLYLSENQEIQKRLQQEIDNVIGSRVPSLLDRVNMPYSEAVLAEILRITSIVSFGAPHAMKSDLIFHGYHLPNKATVFANLYGVHHDTEIWEDPETFRPERFLNEDETKFVQNEALIPFAEGKRKCIGENFGKDTLFLFLISLFQQFKILPDPNKKDQADFKPDFGFLLAPKPFKFVMSSRKCY